MSRRFTQAVLVACEKHLLEDTATQQPDGSYLARDVETGHDSLVSTACVARIFHFTSTGRKRNLGNSQNAVVRNAIREIDGIIDKCGLSTSRSVEQSRAEWISLRYALGGILDELDAPTSSFQLKVTLPPRKFSLTRT